ERYADSHAALLVGHLDASLVPNHATRELNGPSMAQVQTASRRLWLLGRSPRAVVSVYGEGDGSAISVDSGIELIGSALQSRRRYGLWILDEWHEGQTRYIMPRLSCLGDIGNRIEGAGWKNAGGDTQAARTNTRRRHMCGDSIVIHGWPTLCRNRHQELSF